MSPNTTLARRGGAVLIAAVGVIHLVLAKEQLDAKTYVGVLFIAGGIGITPPG